MGVGSVVFMLTGTKGLKSALDSVLHLFPLLSLAHHIPAI